MSLTTEYPLWLTLCCLLLAAGGSWFLYRGNRLDIGGPYGKWIERALVLLRFLCLFVISFLLLGPLMKLVLRKTEKPYIILALDNSQSVTATRDSVFYRKEFPELVRQLQDELAGDYEVKPYLFGKNMQAGDQLSFTEKQTDISRVFEEVKNTYSGQNTGAVILASDGIYNEGANPLYGARELRTPVYALALGDTLQRKDLLIQHVRYNQLSYIGNTFPIQVDLKGFSCRNANATVSLSHNGKEIGSQRFSISNENWFGTFAFEAEAKQEGTQHYVISVSQLPGEISYVNNRFDVFVNVINGRQKILIVAGSVHPDLAAFKEAIAQNENYEAIIRSEQEAGTAALPKDLSLVILHQLPGMRGEGSSLIRQLRDKKIPVLYVLGAQTNLNMLSNLEPSISVSTNRAGTNDALPVMRPDFSSFTISSEEAENMRRLPPLVSPYGNYRINGEHDVLFTQQIGYVKTDYPLIFFTRSEGLRKGFICGEGFWKWRLYDFNISKQQTTNTLISKMIQYLAVKEDKSPFRISGRKRFDENEHVVFDAEVYNDSYELINTPEVQLTIYSSSNRTYPFVFTRTARSYTLDAGILPAGHYRYEAKVVAGTKTETVKGQFTVAPLQVEFTQTVADHRLLNELARQSGGALFLPTQTKALAEAIRANANIKPVIYKQEDLKSWINLKWIFFTLLVLLGTEWFIRKWNGGI